MVSFTSSVWVCGTNSAGASSFSSCSCITGAAADFSGISPIDGMVCGASSGVLTAACGAENTGSVGISAAGSVACLRSSSLINAASLGLIGALFWPTWEPGTNSWKVFSFSSSAACSAGVSACAGVPISASKPAKPGNAPAACGCSCTGSACTCCGAGSGSTACNWGCSSCATAKDGASSPISNVGFSSPAGKVGTSLSGSCGKSVRIDASCSGVSGVKSSFTSWAGVSSWADKAAPAANPAAAKPAAAAAFLTEESSSLAFSSFSASANASAIKSLCSLPANWLIMASFSSEEGFSSVFGSFFKLFGFNKSWNVDSFSFSDCSCCKLAPYKESNAERNTTSSSPWAESEISAGAAAGFSSTAGATTSGCGAGVLSVSGISKSIPCKKSNGLSSVVPPWATTSSAWLVRVSVDGIESSCNSDCISRLVRVMVFTPESSAGVAPNASRTVCGACTGAAAWAACTAEVAVMTSSILVFKPSISWVSESSLAKIKASASVFAGCAAGALS